MLIVDGNVGLATFNGEGSAVYFWSFTLCFWGVTFCFYDGAERFCGFTSHF